MQATESDSSTTSAPGHLGRALALCDAAVNVLSALRDAIAALQANPQLPVFVSDKALAARLEVSVSTVRTGCKRGLYPGAKHFGRAGWRIPLGAVRSAMEATGDGRAGSERDARMPSDGAPAFDRRRLGAWRDTGS